MNRNLILEQDWLTQNGLRVHYVMACLRVNNTYVPLEEDIDIASIIRISSNVMLKPQNAYICTGNIKHNL